METTSETKLINEVEQKEKEILTMLDNMPVKYIKRIIETIEREVELCSVLKSSCR